MQNSQRINKVLVIGSGPIVIGQAAEFDYAGTQACLALKEENIEVVLVNNNPATIMTDEQIADRVYMEPLDTVSLEKIIAAEKPDGLIGSLGGQTGLNLTMELSEKGILEKYNVEILGTSPSSIKQGEDRELFRTLMQQINEPVPPSEIVSSIKEGENFAAETGLPVILRPAYTLGGAGGGFAYSEEELQERLRQALKASPISQVLVEKSIKGWKEVEYEVMRDKNDTCIIVCNMENMDAVGVHTGDSIVTAPSQTLTDRQYQQLRSSSLKVIRALGVVGGCNIQFAVHPYKNEYAIIEVNPRVSRSSALASKATGYPIARIAAKCAVGYHLDEIINPITGNTYASFEPALDYTVVKLPRFPFDKFSEADRTLGTQMKATGEVMAIDRTFEAALNKAVRSLEMNVFSLTTKNMKSKSTEELKHLLTTANDLRLFALGEAVERGIEITQLHEWTDIDPWYLHKVKRIVDTEQSIKGRKLNDLSKKEILTLKKMNISTRRIAELTHVKEEDVRLKMNELNLKPSYKLVDTCAGEFEAVTPYYYSTWQGMDEVETDSDTRRLLIVGSGPIRIGQGVEFDYCSVHAAEAVKALGWEAVVINNNPETVSTDYSVADRLYFEPITAEDVLHVASKENVEGVLLQFGGQTAVNLADELKAAGINVLGTKPEDIQLLEDRDKFYRLLNKLDIPHIEGSLAYSEKELLETAASLSYPVLVRPSYVIGGQSMYICYCETELQNYVSRLSSTTNDKCWPLLADAFLPGKECEADVISDGENVFIPGIFEHIEKAGVHSGDSITVFPPQTLSENEISSIVEISRKIASSTPVIGIMNIQFVIHNGVIYVIEVNPRASRTVPIISKVTGSPMIKEAVKVQLGYSLTSTGLMPPPEYITVKAPVFSDKKLKGVDHSLSPEMKSTGEKIGIADSFAKALTKVFPSPEKNPSVVLSASSRDYAALFEAVSQKINTAYATPGTARYFTERGTAAEAVQSLDEFETLLKKDEIDCVINIPTQGRNPESLGFKLRELAASYDVPCFTHIDTASLYMNHISEDDDAQAVQDLKMVKEEIK
ncbi:carbamoyl-phosphate synthase (glutamine-hydrolyzing) large subunit [Alkalicoccus saliphilus]|uniref:Carbamoyl phosphate synthase large chain n=1 Tax=Alkalicoccus saliphilus TaxID=200989 RepID=A0A2T4U848_9BACI|nr:carbamoyl-phosphate synthase (glutamine-hydrolyzing) large subunit [Alkalicoccus saliphilus]PTL39562.1 carbamoyl-phosphate synthase large subunit [Alkalicoccus saliphilus]